MNAAVKDKLIHNAMPSLFDVPNPPSAVTIKRPLPKRETQPRKRPKTESAIHTKVTSNDTSQV